MSNALNGQHSFILRLLSEQCRNAQTLGELRAHFREHHYVHLPNLMTEEAFEFVKTETARLEQFALNRNFVMDGYETPRIMKALGGEVIKSESPLAYIYTHYEIRELIKDIVEADVHPCLHPNEFMVVNYLTFQGATHGWHLDDPSYALVILTETTKGESGGLLEYIKDWCRICAARGVSAEEMVNETVEHCRSQQIIRTHDHHAGDAYLLRADQCLHRVTELTSKHSRRVVINMAFESTPNPTYGFTANRLYADHPADLQL
jgi:hypothetical protein